MAASANWAANSNFDVYVYNDAGTLRLVTGAAWTSDTARNESLTRINGMWTNNASMTGRYAASSTVTVAANRGLYVGTIRTTGSTGTTTWEIGGSAAGGDPVFFYVWNTYNRVHTGVRVQESTDSWTYTTATFRSWNNSNSNRITFLRGLNEEVVLATFIALTTNTTASIVRTTGLGIDSTSAIAGTINTEVSIGASEQIGHIATYNGLPGLGLHFIQALELSGAAGTTTWYGDAADPNRYQMGLTGTLIV